MPFRHKLVVLVFFAVSLPAVLYAGASVKYGTGVPPQPTATATPTGTQTPESPRDKYQEQRQREEDQRDQKRFGYSDLLQAAAGKDIKRAEVRPGLLEVDVRMTDGQLHTVTYPPTDETLPQRLAESGAEVTVDVESRKGPGFPWGSVLLGVLFTAVLVVVLLRMRRQQAGGGMHKQMSLGKDKDGEKVPSIRFRDVAGCDEAVTEVEEMVDFLKRPGRYLKLGARMPSGVLLYGPPGTGKTLLAKALAGEARVPFFAVSGSEFVQMYVGVGASRVRELFATARKSTTGAVIFIDEIDAIGKTRSNNPAGGSNEEREGTLNQLLVEMDGFSGSDNIIVVAATNRLDTLDPALLRPGRFSRHIHVSPPSRDGRLAILEVHRRGKPLHDDVDLPALADVTAGASGAELAEMLNEGAIMAARDARPLITHADLFEGFLRVVAGPRKTHAALAAGEREAVAYHEAGHVLCAELCPTVDKTLHATINPRGKAAGFAVVGRTDRALHTAQHIHEQLIYILGGRAAEHVIFGHVSSGAANDLEKANSIARAAVEQYGLSAKAGQVIAHHSSGLADQTRATNDEEVRRIVEDAYRDAIALVEEHREQLERLTQALLASGDIDHLEIAAAVAGSVPTSRRPRLAPLPDPEPVPELAVVAGHRRSRGWRGASRAARSAVTAFRAEWSSRRSSTADA